MTGLNVARLIPAMAVLAIAACSGESESAPTPTPSDDAVPFPTVDAASRQVITADGALISPVPPQVMSFPASGTVLDVPVREGQEVQVDTVLAQMDSLPLERAASEARAGLASAREELRRLERGSSAAEIQSARAEVETASATVDRLERGTDVELARLEVERARNTLWGAQAQRDSTCGLTDAGLATQAACDQAQASVQAGEDGVRIAERNLAATEESAPEELAAARARLGAARSRLADLSAGATTGELEAARARVEQAEGALQQATADLDRAILKAPFQATVKSVHVAEGVRVAPGEPIVTLIQTGDLSFVTTNLSERNVGLVVGGSPATINFAAYPDRPVSATVSRVAASAAESGGGTTVFSVYLDLVAPPTDMVLRPGMTGRVEIEVP